ncbi:MAG: flagellar biosynthesis protein FlhF [Steroidobacteraceae bacterium]
MKIRRYIAKDMRQALNQVREAQGPDAVILSSRRTDEGVEVVAAIDFEAETVIQNAATSTSAQKPVQTQQPVQAMTDYGSGAPADFARSMQTIAQAAPAKPASMPMLSDEESGDVGTELRTLRRMLETQLATLAWNDLTRRAPLQSALLKELTQLGLAHTLAVDVVSQVPARLEWNEAQRMMLALIAKRVTTDSERWLDQGGMVAFVGPTGVGKSTLVAKLAARWVLRHGPRDLVLISADSVRMGAQDQIQNLGRLLGVPTYTVDRVVELPALLNSLKQSRLVLIDTAGFSQRDARLASELALLATSHPQLETALVVSASTQAGTLEEAFIRFASAAPKSCVLTKVDEATSLGGSISALTRHGLPLMYMSEGQRIPEDLAPARAHQLVARAVELARRSGAQTDEELLTLRFGGVAHALA